MEKNLCEECKYSEWDVEEYYGNVGRAFVCGCKKADKADAVANKYGEVITCSEYDLVPPEQRD